MTSSSSGRVTAKAALVIVGFASFGIAGMPVGAADLISQPTAEDINEVVVTAQKREERLQDVPVPVSVVSTDSLTGNSETTIADYYTKVPGMSLAPGIGTTTLVTIRGITTGNPFNTTSTVGIMIDDGPFGPARYPQIPEIDPGDLARIEVLRGPQGTLYGSSSMGGLIKYVTVDPSFDEFSGRVGAGTNFVHNGPNAGYDVRGSVNIPITNGFAMRASAFTREDPGYIDNPVTGQNGLNVSHTSGGRLVGLWKPSDDLSLKLNALFQRTYAGGSNDIDTYDPVTLKPLGDLQQSYIPGVGRHDATSQAYSATLTDKIGIATLVAVSNLNVFNANDSFDSSYSPGGLGGVGSLVDETFGVTGAPSFNRNKVTTTTQELRVTIPLGSYADLLLGGFYSHGITRYSQYFPATNVFTGVQVGVLLSYWQKMKTTESAGFADLTFHITDQFDVQVGARESYDDQQTLNGEFVGPYVGNTDVPVEPVDSKSPAAFTYLFTPRYRFSSDWMAYVRIASGFRPGGQNSPFPGASYPLPYKPDTTKNYELGTKVDFFDRKLSIDASTYYINWSGIQLALIDPATSNGFFANAAKAKSQGIELSVDSHPLGGLNIGGWVVFSDAKLTDPLPPGAVAAGSFGAAGSPLPYSSRFSGAITISQDFPITGKYVGFVGGSLNYLGDRKDMFTACAAATADFTCPGGALPRQDLPAYAKTDLNAGVRFDTWTVNLYANNVTDRRGLISGGIGTPIPASIYIIPPRKVGLSVSASF